MSTKVVTGTKPPKDTIRLFTTDRPDTPVPGKQRIQYLDILRGIAILFIFIANIRYLSGEYFIADEVRANLGAAFADHILQIIAFFLVDGKFYSVFSILFGIGFAVQYQRMANNDKLFVPFFRKRMLGLLLIGSVHLFLIWLGDILTLYALTGFLLILFRNFSDKRLLIWSAILLLMPVVHWLIMFLTDSFYPGILIRRFNVLASQAISGNAAVQSENGFNFLKYLSISNLQTLVEINLVMPLLRLAMILLEGRIFKVLALFLLGVYAGRQIIEHNLLSNTARLKKIILWGLVIGIPMNLLRTWVEFSNLEGTFRQFAEYMLNALSLAPMAVAYCAIVALALTRPTVSLNWFAAVGRTALSNYMFQTVICIFIFYEVGLGIGPAIGYSSAILIAILIFGWQIVFSTIWLWYFRFGPVEWIWRQITYGKLINNRQTSSITSLRPVQ